MIRIQKRRAIPVPLATLGRADQRRLKRLYTADPAACQVPRNRRLLADPAIYAHPDVKAALIADQHGKCCYCESRFEATGFGDVEHFRPKAGVRQAVGGMLEKPGYYWLAYQWKNLFFSCEICNRRYKGNWFPLLNPAARARHHGQPLSREQPVLPDPGREDPTADLKFMEHLVKGRTARGKACVRAYGLDRQPLNRRREEFLTTLKLIRFAAALNLDSFTPAELAITLADLGMSLPEARIFVSHAQEVWTQAALNTAEFAGMVRARFPHLPQQ